MALALYLLALIVSAVSLFFIVNINKKINNLLELNAFKPIPKGRKKKKMLPDFEYEEEGFEDFDVEQYVKKQREEEGRKKEEEEQKKQMQMALEQLSGNPELLAAIAKMV